MAKQLNLFSSTSLKDMSNHVAVNSKKSRSKHSSKPKLKNGHKTEPNHTKRPRIKHNRTKKRKTPKQIKAKLKSASKSKKRTSTKKRTKSKKQTKSNRNGKKSKASVSTKKDSKNKSKNKKNNKSNSDNKKHKSSQNTKSKHHKSSVKAQGSTPEHHSRDYHKTTIYYPIVLYKDSPNEKTCVLDQYQKKCYQYFDTIKKMHFDDKYHLHTYGVTEDCLLNDYADPYYAEDTNYYGKWMKNLKFGYIYYVPDERILSHQKLHPNPIEDQKPQQLSLDTLYAYAHKHIDNHDNPIVMNMKTTVYHPEH